MKLIKKLVVWISLSLILQCGALFYADKYMLSTETTYKSKKVTKSQPAKADAEVKIPERATHLGVSFDAKYVAYYDSEVLKVVNTKTGKIKDVEFDNGVKVSFYKWLPDRNRMLIAEKTTTKNGSGFKLSYYDVDKDVKEEIKNLTWADKKSEVEDIQVSTLTNVIYVKVAHSGKRSSIYWLNIMKEMRNIETRSYLIGSIRTIPHADKLVYEDLTYKRICVTNVNKPITIKGVANPCLISVDGDDKIYVGQLNEDKVVKIYSGTLKDDTSTWKVTDIKEPVYKEDIYVTSEGKIYINDSLKGIVHEVDSGKETIYKGKLVQMYEDGIISISDGKIVKTQFK